MEKEILDLQIKLKEHKEVIMKLLETYVFNLDNNGNPKASINDILKLIDKASKLVKEKITERELEKVCPKEYVVIADYPESNFKIGDILRFRGITWGCNEPQKFIDNPEKYPHIFKKLIKTKTK